MEFAELVMRRRTVRRFEETPVDREVLEGIARLAVIPGHVVHQNRHGGQSAE
jgi:nitroreductase